MIQFSPKENLHNICAGPIKAWQNNAEIDDSKLHSKQWWYETMHDASDSLS
jgi:hypothetical protein